MAPRSPFSKSVRAAAGVASTRRPPATGKECAASVPSTSGSVAKNRRAGTTRASADNVSVPSSPSAVAATVSR